MPLTDYKGLQVHDAPTGEGGVALNANFEELADRAGTVHITTTNPGVNNDGVDTAGAGVAFYPWSKWLNSSTGHLWICRTNGTGAAVWVDVTGSSGLANVVEDTTPQLGGNLDMNGSNIQGVSPTEMARLAGVTSGIQDQLNAKLHGTNNLSDLSSAATARTNLGLGTAATQDSSAFDAAGTAAGLVTGLLDYKGVIDASTNPNYSAGVVGDVYIISVAGKVGGASGKAVDVGDAVLCTANNGGGTEGAVGTSWVVLEHNVAGALLAANNLSDVANAATARTNLGLIGAVTSITGADLTADRALVSDGSGKVAVSSITTTELEYLDGVTSAIQSQFSGTAKVICWADTCADLSNAASWIGGVVPSRDDDVCICPTSNFPTCGTICARRVMMCCTGLVGGTIYAKEVHVSDGLQSDGSIYADEIRFDCATVSGGWNCAHSIYYNCSTHCRAAIARGDIIACCSCIHGGNVTGGSLTLCHTSNYVGCCTDATFDGTVYLYSGGIRESNSDNTCMPFREVRILWDAAGGSCVAQLCHLAIDCLYVGHCMGQNSILTEFVRVRKNLTVNGTMDYQGDITLDGSLCIGRCGSVCAGLCMIPGPTYVEGCLCCANMGICGDFYMCCCFACIQCNCFFPNVNLYICCATLNASDCNCLHNGVNVCMTDSIWNGVYFPCSNDGGGGSGDPPSRGRLSVGCGNTLGVSDVYGSLIVQGGDNYICACHDNAAIRGILCLEVPATFDCGIAICGPVTMHTSFFDVSTIQCYTFYGPVSILGPDFGSVDGMIASACFCGPVMLRNACVINSHFCGGLCLYASCGDCVPQLNGVCIVGSCAICLFDHTSLATSMLCNSSVDAPFYMQDAASICGICVQSLYMCGSTAACSVGVCRDLRMADNSHFCCGPSVGGDLYLSGGCIECTTVCGNASSGVCSSACIINVSICGVRYGQPSGAGLLLGQVAPSSPSNGSLYYDPADCLLKYYDGNAWKCVCVA